MIILTLNSPQAALSNSGGKGMNLARLARAGLPVPGGYLITAAAYRRYVAANNLSPFIQQTLANLQTDDPAALNRAAAAIRARFAAGTISANLQTAIITAYHDVSNQYSVNSKQSPVSSLQSPPVAVRSSATAEDLPDMSFAGQQDTFLNVLGEEALLKAVVACWSSLWTARAIGYRARNSIPQDEVALAVVVQAMVQSEASGVLFTANPLTGKRSQMVIDATLGLGEALVSGLVEPDQFVVDGRTGHILQRQIGEKATVIHGRAHGGVHTETRAAADQPAISDAVIAQLVELGRQTAAHFQSPQDIEWAWADNRLALLQSRPITSLFPIPEWAEQNPQLQLLFSFASVQGMLDPITPLGQDTLQSMLAGLGQLFRLSITRHQQTAVLAAAERLWINLTPLVRHPIGRRIEMKGLQFIDPTASQALRSLEDDPRLQPEKGWFRLRTFWRVLRFFLPIMSHLLRTLRHPDRERGRFQEAMAQIEDQYARQFDAADSLSQRLAVFETFLRDCFPVVLSRFLPVIAGGMSSLNLTIKLAAAIRDQGFDPLILTRGLPHNVTTEMDLLLWQTAQKIQTDEASRRRLLRGDPADLAVAYQAGTLPQPMQTAVAHFLEQYGMRGLAEIDLGRPRWQDNPAAIFHTLQSYLQISDPDRAPDVVFARGAAEAEAAIPAMAAALRQTRHGRLKARLLPIAARRLRALAGLRESPKFLMIRLFGHARRALLSSAADLAAQNVIAQPDDIFFLRLDELRAIAAGETEGWQAIIRQRRHVYARERQRRQIPNLLLSDGTAFYEGTAVSGDGDLGGTPVSPGVVEGVVHILLDPHGAQLAPGEILVCPGTDPAWTPLFLAAGGLITEVGGLMTHGSVVAREYGIPAVVGVYQATSRLQTGQRIRLDGSSGAIEILDS